MSSSPLMMDYEGNRRSGIALAMRHRLSGLSTYGLKGQCVGDEHPVMPQGMAPFTFTANTEHSTLMMHDIMCVNMSWQQQISHASWWHNLTFIDCNKYECTLGSATVDDSNWLCEISTVLLVVACSPVQTHSCCLTLCHGCDVTWQAGWPARQTYVCCYICT